jgi:hypothetical protein
VRIGLFSNADSVPFSALEPVCVAIRRQLREVGAAWGVDATVEACQLRDDTATRYVTVSDSPVGFSPLATGGDEGPLGEHRSPGGAAFAQVLATASWSVTASHECIEMAVNEMCDRTLLRPPLAAYSAIAGSDEPVAYLVEICDPCQSGAHAYLAPGTHSPVMLSDFVLPEYFEPLSKVSRLSFNRSVKHPFEILSHGCLSWGVPQTKKLWQQWVGGDGVSKEPKSVDDWEPITDRAALYVAEPAYKAHRVPGEKRLADFLALFRPGDAPG